MKITRLALVVLLFTSGSAWGGGPTFTDTDVIITNSFQSGPDLEFQNTASGTFADWEICADAACNAGITPDNSIAISRTGSALGSGIPFVIEDGTDSDLLYLDSLERIGINTSAPGYTVDAEGDRIRLKSGTKNIMLRADGTDTDLEATGASLFLRSSTPGENIVMNPFADDGNVGIGITQPERQLHLRGSNAVFRMDRSADTAAFLLVRTTAGGSPLKTFVVGTNASGTNTGEFIINDLGTAVSGGGSRRMTITNSGSVIFTGSVSAPAFITTSSRRFKENIEQILDPLAVTQQLQGVRFVWKDSGRPALGLIAEEVASVLPEVVERDEKDGQLKGVNYSALVAVLVEAIKAQQQQMEAQQAKALEQQAELASLKAQVAEQASTQAKVASLEARLTEFEILKVRLAEIENLLAERALQRAALVQR